MMIGSSITGTISSTSPISLIEVMASIASPPARIIMLRSASDRVEPITDWISVVSVVIRDRISPVMIRSKNAGDRRITRAKTALRISATTRSPSRVTK